MFHCKCCMALFVSASISLVFISNHQLELSVLLFFPPFNLKPLGIVKLQLRRKLSHENHYRNFCTQSSFSAAYYYYFKLSYFCIISLHFRLHSVSMKNSAQIIRNLSKYKELKNLDFYKFLIFCCCCVIYGLISSGLLSIGVLHFSDINDQA